MAKPRIFFIDNQIKTEDGMGGTRDLTAQELLNARVDIPENLKETWAKILEKTQEKTAAAEAGRRGRDVRLGKAEPGSAPDVPLNEMGIGRWERFVVMNLVNNRSLAKDYLRMHGYDIADYGDGYNFAARKGPGQPWRVADPKGGADFGWDLLDWTSDALSATAITAGIAAGGPAGGVMAGMGVEAARQGAGMAAGVPQQPDAAKMLWAGAGGLMAPTVGGLAEGPLTTGVNKAASGMVKLSSKIIGADPEVVMARARIPGFGAQKGIVQAAQDIRTQLAAFTEDLTPARKEARAIIDHLEANKVKVDMSPMFDKMRAMQLGEGGAVSSTKAGLAGVEDPSIHTLASRLFQRAKATLAVDGLDETAVPIKLAEDMKRSIQKSAARAKSYENIELTSATRSMLRDFAATGRKQVAAVADASGIVGPQSGKLYSSNMAEVDKAMHIVSAMEQSFNTGTTETKRAASAQRAVRALYSDSGTEYMDHLHNFDKLVGTKLAEEAHNASVGKAFGQAGDIGIMPRFTPMGNILMVGGGAGVMTGNPLKAGAALAAASPMVNMAAMKMGPGIARARALAAKMAGTLPVKLTAQGALSELLSRTGGQ